MGRTRKLKEQVSTVLAYEGISESGVLNNEAKWQIKRITTVNNQTIEEYANDGEFSQIWNNRASLFAALPFVNTHSIQLDGVNDRMDVAHHSSIDFARLVPFTLSLWIKSPNTGSKNYIEKMSTSIGYRLYDSGGSKIQFEFRGTGGTGDRIRVETTSATNVNNGYWHNVILTYSGSGAASGAKIYVDGSLQGTTTLNDTLTTNPTNTGVLSVGSRSGGGTNFVGNIDEVSIWDGALNATEVAELYNSGFATDLSVHSNGSLVSWWTFNDITSFPTVPDNESTNNGTLVNMTPGDVETEIPHV